MFAQALAACGRLLGLGPKQAGVEDDRRAWGRAHCDMRTRVRPAAGAIWQPATVANISQGGIGLLLPTGFTPGALVGIAVPGPDDTAEVLACVVRCDRLEDGTHSVGCTFAAILSDEDLARFGARQAQAGPDDQRLWERFPCKAQAFLQRTRPHESPAVRAAVVRDISAGGIAVEADSDLHVGDLVQIDIVRDDETLFTTLASITRVSLDQLSGRHVIGANFIGELPEDCLARMME